MWRVIARRSDTVWLLTEVHGDPPRRARVLDLSLARLHPPHDTAAILQNEGWTMIDDAEGHPDVEILLRGIEIMRVEEELPPRLIGAI